MAEGGVGIPVYVDIQGAFQEAASITASAAKPLEVAVDRVGLELSEKLGAKLANSIQKLSKAGPDDEKLTRYAAAVRRAANNIRDMSVEQGRLTMGKKDVRDLATEVTRLANKWKNAPLTWKINEKGELRSQAIKLIESIGKAGEQMLAFAHAEEYAQTAEMKHVQELSKEITTINDLNTAIAAWRQELNAAQGNPLDQNFIQAARSATQLEDKLARINTQVRAMGSNMGSINRLQSQLQALNMEYNALGKSDRMGAKGKQILADYRAISVELEKEGKSLAQIVQEEKRRADAVAKGQQKRQYENAILNSTVKTMKILQEQERILSDRLSRAQIGTQAYKDLQTQLQEVRMEMKRAEGAAEGLTTALGGQSRVLRSLISYASMYVSIFGLLRFVKQIRDVTGELEYQRVALGHLIQDEEYGYRLFEKIKAAAIESPFRIKDLVTYTKQLAAYRIEQEELFSTMTRLADISAGLGVDMNRLILAYGQVRAASVLRGQELRQFTESGIPLVQLLAEKFTELNGKATTTAQVFDMISKRAVPFSMIAEIFEDMTDKGGAFYQMQIEQADTLKGRWEKLKDAFDIGLQSVGETKTFEWANKQVLQLLTLLAKNLRSVAKALEATAGAWVVYRLALAAVNIGQKKTITLEMTQAALEKAESARISRITVKILGETAARKRLADAIIAQQTATTLLGKAWNGLKVAFLTNPIGIIAGAVAGLIVLFTAFRKKVQDINEVFEAFDKLIENTSEGIRLYDAENGKIEKTIRRYEALASMTDRTVTQNQRLHQTMQLLRDTFPELAGQIDGEAESLEVIAARMREINRENEERIRFRGEEALRQATDKLNKEIERETILYKQLGPLMEEVRKAEAQGSAGGIENARRAYNELNEKIEESEKLITGLQKRIVSLDRILHPEKIAESFNAWQRLIYEMREVSAGNLSVTLFSEDDIAKWAYLDDALDDIAKKKNEAQDREDALWDSLQHQNGELEEQIRLEYELAVAERERYEAMEALFNKKMTELAKDVQNTFPEIMKETFKDMEKDTYAKIGLFTKGELLQIEDITNLYDLWAKKIKAVESAMKNYNKRLAETVDPKVRQSILDTIESLTTQFDWLKKLGERYGFVLETKSHGGSQRDPLIDIYKNRTRFVEDFSKGVRDLNKYLGEQNALLREREIMKGRGANLGFDVETMTGDYNQVMAYYDKVIEDIKAKIAEKGGRAWRGLGVEAILARDTKNRTIKAWQDLLQEIFKQKTDFQTRQLEQDIENAIRKVKEQVKQSGAARNFFQEIFDLTGDRDLAMNLSYGIYGTIGRENAGQEILSGMYQEVEAFRQKLEELPEGFDTSLFDAMIGAIGTGDIKQIQDELMNMPDKLRESLEGSLDEYEKYLSGWYTDFYKTYQKAKTYDERIATEERLREKKLAEARSRGMSNEDINAINKYYDRRVSGIQLEALKDTYEWTKAFEDLDSVSSRTLRRLISLIDTYINKYRKDLTPEQLKTLTRQREQATQQLLSRSPYESLANSVKRYGDIMKKAFSPDFSIKDADDAARALKDMETSLDAISGQMSVISSSAQDIATVLGLEDNDYMKAALDGISKGIGGITAALNLMKVALAAAETAGGWISLLAAALASVYFIVKNMRFTWLNKQIDTQQTKIDALAFSYDRLEDSMSRAFGSDYIRDYQQQLSHLVATQEAYEKQAALERKKGKEADEEKIREYEQNAIETAGKIAEKQRGLQEFFAGTDLASAARDFASAWIDAYKEFGSTTNAMKEKFQEMVENMVLSSLAAQIMQSLLQPVFEEIDKRALDDGSLNAQDISEIAALASSTIPQINSAMTNLMNQLAAAGYNMRQKAGSFTGIARNIANASEESITGLAAGINTQNFYMQNIDKNVAAILSLLGGNPNSESAAAGGDVEPMSPYQTQVLTNLGSLPQMRDDMAAMRAMLDKVIKPNGVTSTHRVIVG